MHEKDIELTRLLLNEYKERQSKAASLVEKLSVARQELDSVMDVRKQREGIHDVLSRAASLLEREDLGVDLPDSAELEGRVRALEGEFGAIETDLAKYKGIVEELQEKAPELLQKASGDGALAGGEDPPPNPKLASVEDVEGANPSQAPEVKDASNEPAHAVLSKLSKRERAKLLKVFKLKTLTEKEAYAHGRGAIYLVDTKSTFEQVKSYNFDPKADNAPLYEKLALQFYALSLELSGSFHLIYNADFPHDQSFGDLVSIDTVVGDEGAYAKKLQELVASYSGKLRTVCLVTGNNDLAQAVDGQGAHLIPLGDFFNM